MLNDNLQNAIAFLIAVYAGFPIAVVIGIMLGTIVGFIAFKWYRFKWWVQKHRLILRYDLRVQDKIVKRWETEPRVGWAQNYREGEWIFYKTQDQLTWFERNILLDKRF